MINFSHLASFPPSKPRIYKKILKQKAFKSASVKTLKKNPNFYRVPSQNLPPIILQKDRKKKSPEKIVSLPTIKLAPANSITYALLSTLDTRKINERSSPMKPEIGFFSFPKKGNKNIKHQKRNEKKEMTMSSWANESNNILWTLPGSRG